MKKYLILIFLLACFLIADSQIIRPNPTTGFQQFGTPVTLTRINGLVYPAVGYAQALYADTTAMNATYLKNVPLSRASTSDGRSWVRNLTATGWLEELNSINGWSTTGNSGTTPGINFIGTTDSVDWVVKTNNTERIRVLAAGNIGIGTSTPAKIFHTVGTVRMASLGTASSDTTTNKPLGINSSGDVIPMTYWPGGGSGSSTSPVLTISQPAAITDTINATTWTFSGIGQKEWFGFLDEDYIMGHEGFQYTDSSAYFMKYGVLGTSGLGILNQPGTSSTTSTTLGWELRAKAPFFGVETKIIQTFGSGTEDQIMTGIMTGRDWSDANRGIVGVIWNRIAGVFYLYVKKSGTDYLLASIGATPSYPFTMGLGIADKIATIWYKDDAGYQTHTNYNLSSYFDMRDTSVLNSFTTYFDNFYTSGNNGSYAKITNPRWGYLKGVGMANYSPITFEDGNPLQSGGNYYLLHNAAHSSGSTDSLEIPVANAQILKWNPTSNAVNVQAKIFTERSGKLYGENSGSCVYDSTNAKWYFFIPNWGNYNDGTNPVNVYLYESKYFPSGITVLKNGTKLNLPSGTTQYDPDVKKINGRWNIVYTVGFGGSGGIRRAISYDLSTWTNTDSVTVSATEEGMKLIKLGGKWKILTAVIGSNTCKVRDTTLAELGTFTAPAGVSFAGVPAHPSIIGVNQQDGTTEYYWIFHDNRTFNGSSYSWGNIHFLKANQKQTGNDYGVKTFIGIENNQIGKNNYDLPNYNYTWKKLNGSAISYTLGNVGIGTNTPQHPLQIFGALKVGGDAGQQMGSIALGDDATTSLYNGIYRGTSAAAVGGGNWVNVAGYDGINLLTGHAVFGSQTIRVTIDNSSGNVGIGQSSPTALLHIKAGTATANTAPLKLTTGTSLTTAEAGALEYSTPQLFFTNGAAVRQELFQGQQSRVSTQFDKTSSTTLADITGLTANVAAGKTYRFEAILSATSNIAGGVKYAISGTCTATNIIYEEVTTDGGVLKSSNRASALGTAVTITTTTTNPYTRITGTITVNAAGTLTVQFAQNASNGTASSVLVGSTFVVTEML